MDETSRPPQIDLNELRFNYVRAAGPGGQNVNKVATSVQLHFDVRNSPSLTEDVKERLIQLGGSKISSDGVLVIEAKRYRTQEQNRADAIQRLITLINKASEKLPERRATKPTRASKVVRLESKRRQSDKKRSRQGNQGTADW
jgi:ribosome-associated protein